MGKQGKVWGETEEIFRSDTISINLLRIKKGGFCSEHYHHAKVNLFQILSGSLDVYQFPIGASEGEKPDRTRLRAGEATSIPTGVWHYFQAVEETVCLEIYSVRLVGEDIVRRSQGGVEK